MNQCQRDAAIREGTEEGMGVCHEDHTDHVAAFIRDGEIASLSDGEEF